MDYITDMRRVTRTILDISNEYDIPLEKVIKDVRECIESINRTEKNPRRNW